MNNWLLPNTIYLTLAGSQSYGLNNESSDTDMKGIAIPPRDVEYNLFHRWEQAENSAEVESQFSWLKNPKNPKFESVVYSLRKFMVLAAQVNPNIVELLYTDESDRYICERTMSRLLQNRELFLSSKAKFTFSGYAFAQAKKIKRHRKWIVQGELGEPKRSDFGLSEVKPRQLDEIFGYIKSEVERWNLSKFSLDDMDRNDLKETVMELVNSLVSTGVDPLGWDNWPNKYGNAALHEMANTFNLKDEVVDLIYKERKFKDAVDQYNSWLKWKEERNPARRELEVKSGYDTKHASHLVRLMRMGYEILTEGKVIVKRPDREELLAIKNGAWDYDRVMSYADDMQKKLDEAYKVTKLPKSVDFEKVNSLYHELFNEYETKT